MFVVCLFSHSSPPLTPLPFPFVVLCGRRNSYTTPCALNVERLAGWLEHRGGAIRELEIAVLYPDAEALLPALLPPLAPALRRLVLRGACSDWPYQWVDWRWLAGMSQVGGAGQGWRAGRVGVPQTSAPSAPSACHPGPQPCCHCCCCCSPRPNNDAAAISGAVGCPARHG